MSKQDKSPRGTDQDKAPIAGGVAESTQEQEAAPANADNEPQGQESAPTNADNEEPQEQESTQATTSSVLEDIAYSTMREHGLTRVYVTTDGTAFYERSDAHNHARNLEDDTIFAVEPMKTDE